MNRAAAMTAATGSIAQREHAEAHYGEALAAPVVAVEWSCHAATTIKDATGKVLAECSARCRTLDEDIAVAAEIVRRVNAHDELVAALATLANRNATIYANEVTLPLASHAAAMRALRAAREALRNATKGAAS